ncbi:MAG: sigma-E processing peptidase SpoIIGA [Clostridiales bacterium]|jgi:sigma-E processing peptidase SpoIIGA|nr:sigma-E processing peptidase SpoIIGA [Clostridiales bacterium]
MKIYIEYLFIDNTALNLLILYLTLATLREKIDAKRLFLSALIGTAFAFLLPFVKYFSILYKAAAAFLMTAVFKNKTFKAYLLRTVVFIAYSFFLGGVISGLFNLKSEGIAGAAVYNGDAVSLTVLGASVFFVLIRKLFLLGRERRRARYYYKTKLVLKGFCRELTGYYDSGNKLYDANDHTPAVILSAEIGEEIVAAESPEIFGLEVGTVGGKKTLKAFKVDKFWIYSEKGVNIIDNMTAAIADGSFKNFTVLLHSEMCGEKC